MIGNPPTNPYVIVSVWVGVFVTACWLEHTFRRRR